MINRTYNSTIILLLAVLLWGFILYSSVPFYYEMYTQSTNEIGTNISSSKNCEGFGDSNCYNKLVDHINNISGLQVSSSVFIGDGKFNTTIIKENPDGSGVVPITTTITVDCNCQIVNSGGKYIN
jgi:archaellum component FlaF (FlaF/FlaG flagellin family)